jgi:exodeoxyribonuclease-3
MANARSRNIGSRIDNFLTTAALQPAIVSADVHMDIMGSDHCPVSLEIDL